MEDSSQSEGSELASEDDAPIGRLLEAAPKSKFRLNAKRVGVTFPQCDVDKETVQSRLIKEFGDALEFYIIAQEHHKDGHLHLHCLLGFHQKVNWFDCNRLDFLVGKHGNLLVPRSLRAWAQYCCKEDPSFIAHGIAVDKLLAHKASRSEALGKRLLEGASPLDLMREDPGFYLLHSRQIKEMHADVLASQVLAAPLLPWESAVYKGSQPCMEEITCWLNANIKCSRSFKQPQMYLWGPSGVRKTSLILKLVGYLKICWMTWGPFWNGYSDDYDLIVFDEFNSCYGHSVQELNRFLEGVMINLSVKGGFVQKKKNPPVVILSNWDLLVTLASADAVALAAFRNRVTVISTADPLDLDNFMIYEPVTPPVVQQ